MIAKLTNSALLILCLLIILVPCLSGLTQTVLGSFGIMPELKEANAYSLSYYIQYFTEYSSLKSIIISLLIATLSTFISVFLAFSYIAVFNSAKNIKLNILIVLILLSTPHFLLGTAIYSFYSASGLFCRVAYGIFNVKTDCGFSELNPNLMIILTLIVKETAFIVFVSLAQIKRLDLDKILKLGASLKFSNYRIYKYMLLPNVLRSIKLPILIIASYALTAVEVPLIFSDIKNSPESIIVFKLFNDPLSLTSYLTGFAGSIWLVAMFGLVYLIWVILSNIGKFVLDWQIVHVKHRDGLVVPLSRLFFTLLLILFWLLPMLELITWSFSDLWQFPNLLPNHFTMANYNFVFDATNNLFLNTFFLGLLSALIGTIMAIIVVELLKKWPKLSKAIQPLIVLPLVLPQISYLFGFQVLLEQTMLAGSFISLLWSHLIFCFAYAFIILNDQEKHLNPRYLQTAYSLGLSPIAAWLRIKFFLILPVLKLAFATAFSVSAALYLPTLFASSGRYMTLITESIALLQNANPKLSASFAISQLILPLIVFAIFVRNKNIFK